MPKLVRADIVPGAELVVRRGTFLSLDPHILLSMDLEPGTRLLVLTAPRKQGGINLVRIRTEGQFYEVFYCDILNHCEHAAAPFEGSIVGTCRRIAGLIEAPKAKEPVKKAKKKAKPVAVRPTVLSRYERLLSVEPPFLDEP